MRLTDLIAELAKDTVRIQILLDRAYAMEVEEFLPVLAQTPEAFSDILRELVPARYTVRQNHVSVSLIVGIENRRGFEVYVSPLNLNYFIRFRIQSEAASRIQIDVAQVPIATSKTT